jgi:hypothetical protein
MFRNTMRNLHVVASLNVGTTAVEEAVVVVVASDDDDDDDDAKNGVDNDRIVGNGVVTVATWIRNELTHELRVTKCTCSRIIHTVVCTNTPRNMSIDCVLDNFVLVGVLRPIYEFILVV